MTAAVLLIRRSAVITIFANRRSFARSKDSKRKEKAAQRYHPGFTAMRTQGDGSCVQLMI
jgi:hypothetical protein